MSFVFLYLFLYFIIFVGYFCFLTFEKIYFLLASATLFEIIYYIVCISSYLIATLL